MTVYYGHMTKKYISAGTVHRLPPDLQTTLTTTPKALAVWEAITPLARNEWICWVEDAKKLETRIGRVVGFKKERFAILL
jgi:uncharacterized protein YdeI (YjbR/CyaY-like superfamily)